MMRARTVLMLALLSVLPAGRSVAQDTCETWIRSRPWGSGRIFWVNGNHPDARDRGPATMATPWATPDPVRVEGTLHGGDVVAFMEGTYPAAIRPADHGTGEDGRITFVACPGHQVVIDGSDPLVAPWERSGEGWSTFAFETRGPVGGRHDRHIVIADGRVLKPVEDVGGLAPGTFIILDHAAARPEMLVRLPNDADPSGSDLRMGRRGTLFGPPAASRDCPTDPSQGWYRLIGLRFRFGASPAQHGAVCLGGTGVVAEDIVVEWTNGLGIEMSGSRHVLRSSRSTDNGQAGVGGECDDCLLEDVRSDRNNWRGHDRFWEAGGGKWTDTHRTTFLRYSASDNDGVGLWLDGNASGNRIVDVDIRNSELAALMFELRSDSNRVVGGRLSGTRYRGWTGTGLLVQAAGGNVVEDVLITGNEGKGIWLRSDRRVPTGGLEVLRSVLDHNLTADREGDYEISVEQDIEPGGTPAPVRFSDVRIRSGRPDTMFGLSRDRESGLRPTNPAGFFGSGAVVIE